MSKRIAILGLAAVLAASALPAVAAAADLYGYGGDDRPLAHRGWDDGIPGGPRAFVEPRDAFGPVDRRGPGPVVFDERDPGRRDGYFGAGGPVEPRLRRRAYGVPGDFGPRDDVGDGYGYRGGPDVRPAAAYRAGPPPGPDFGGPEGGCTVERARSVTPAGWEKIVTHRTCYRR